MLHSSPDPLPRSWLSRAGFGPLALVLCLVVLLGALFYLLHARTYDETLAAVPRDLAAASGEVADRFDAAVDHLNLLAADFATGAMDRARFEALASAFTKNHHEVLSIAWVDGDDRVRWVVPRESATAILDVKIAERDEDATLGRAKMGGKAAFSEPYVSVDGQRLLAIFVPVITRAKGASRVASTLRCLFSVDGILQHAVPEWLTTRYEIDLVDAHGVVFGKRSDGRKTDPNLLSTKTLAPSWPGVALKLQRYAEGVDWEVVLFVALIVGLATGVALAVVELSRDNKRRRLLAQEMEAAKNLAEEASQAKTEFLANVSHEIRTPIGAIIGYAEMQETPHFQADEMRAAAHAIKRNGQHLLHLINDLLDVSKIEAGLLDVEPVDVDLATLVRETAVVCLPLAAAKGLRLRFAGTGRLPRTVRTDPLRLKQILVNVVGNAIKFTEKGGVTVVLSLALDQGKRPALSFTVEDTGIGVTVAQKARLFKTFVQADNSIARRYGGTGLGLALSKRLAGLLGGDLVLSKSTPAIGSVFVVTIDPGVLDGEFISSLVTDEVACPPGPGSDSAKVDTAADLLHARPGEDLADPRNAHDHHAKDKGARGRAADTAAVNETQMLAGRRFLLVEDSPDNQIIFAEFLAYEGAQVTTARDGLDGIAAFDREVKRRGIATFDAIIMDVQMPGLDGYQATEEIRRRGYRGPILALSAHAARGARERCLAAGCDEYLSKPVARDALTTTLTRLLSRSKGLDHGQAEGAPTPVSAGRGLTSNLVHDPRVQKVLPGFIGRLPRRLAAFRAALTAHDWQALAAEAHQLKGTAGNFGYPSISTAAAGVEERARSISVAAGTAKALHDEQALTTYIDDLGELVARATRSFDERVSEPPSGGRGADEEPS